MSRPNLLVIMSDEHSPDIIGASGDTRVRTPHLDRLAAEGATATAATCNNPICVPSRCSFLTGMTTQQIEVWSLSDTLRSDLATWPIALGAAGYDTAISGRMHFWWPDKLHGFQRRLAGDTQTRVCTGTFELFEPGPARDQRAAWLREHWLDVFRDEQTGQGPHHGYHDDREATDAAAAFIRERTGDTPWALCVGYLCPHAPMTFPEEFYRLYEDMPVELEELDPTLPPMYHHFARQMGCDQPLPPEARRHAVRAYYAMVTYVDTLVGDLLTALAETGQLDNTYVVYTSDHGEMLGRRGLWYKNQLLEPSIRTPLLVRGPGIPAGSQLHHNVSLLDLYPTFCEWAGAEPWEEIAGNSLAGILAGRDDAAFADRPVFVEYADYGIGQPSACIRRGHLKLIAARTWEPVLYDLAADPGETINRYGDPAYADAVRQLEADLAAHWDADDTYRRVTRNQRRTVMARQNLLNAAARAGKQV